ncbi:putative Dynein intermediate chain 3, ciliary [Hypsibius exemplaris]|uniref:Dynein intermediate chain 3, ciliary n=1 Tax=Hypsibius exemplaris TaxID=2072580 RepID=A0A1W0X091_HYPEX|nr:putative Dynein intermediate chain 3, ciliary [Hypsibius exemplaris]
MNGLLKRFLVYHNDFLLHVIMLASDEFLYDTSEGDLAVCNLDEFIKHIDIYSQQPIDFDGATGYSLYFAQTLRRDWSDLYERDAEVPQKFISYHVSHRVRKYKFSLIQKRKVVDIEKYQESAAELSAEAEIQLYLDDPSKPSGGLLEEERESFQTVENDGAASADVEEIVRDNNIFDYLDQYFEDDEVDVTFADGFNVKLLAEYQDSTCKFNRKVQDLFFFPEDSSKVAVAYQEIGDPSVPYNDAAIFASVWDINLLYKPVQNFIPPFRLFSIVCNPNETNCVVGSLWTGQLCQWDIRAGEEPIVTTELEISHNMICRKVQWLQSKTMTEIVSVGMDGQMIFWDIRKWDEPIERIILDPRRTKMPTLKDGAPCACVDFDQGIPSRLCAGSEKGFIFNINRKSKNAHEKVTWVWKDVITPILSLQRNIAHPRYMLAVSCDDAKVDNKCLTCVAAHEEGRLYGVGCINGTWGITEVSNALYIPTQKEKNDVGELLEREGRREKILEGRGRERLAQIRKEAVDRAEAVATAVKAGKAPPPAEPEDIIDPAYNLPFRPGPIIPQEQTAKKELPPGKIEALAAGSMKQYETWVQEEDNEMRHRLLPTIFDWQAEDEGVGTIMAKLKDKKPGHIDLHGDTETRTDFAGRHQTERYELRQLGLERHRNTAALRAAKQEELEKSVGERLTVPMDFAAERRKQM